MVANQRLLAENALIDIPRSFSDYVDAYRASSSDTKSTRNLSSLREKLNYDTKKKYSKMLDTKTVNDIYNKPSSYNRNSEYDLIWRQASMAKKFKPNSSISNHSTVEKDTPSTSFKKPSIAIRKLKELETINNKASANSQSQPPSRKFPTSLDYMKNNNSNIGSGLMEIKLSKFEYFSKDKPSTSDSFEFNNKMSPNYFNDTYKTSRFKSKTLFNDSFFEVGKGKNRISPDHSELNINSNRSVSTDSKTDRNKNHIPIEHSRLYNTYQRFSSNQNINNSNYRSSTEDLRLNHEKYQTSPEIHNTDFHHSNSNRGSSSINRILFNNPSDDTKKYRTNNSIDSRFDGRISGRGTSSNSRYHPYQKISYDHPPINRSIQSLNDHPHIDIKEPLHESDSEPEPESPKDTNKEFSSREILRYLKPYLKKRVNTHYISREQYKKLSRDLTYYVIKRMGKDYSGEHKLKFDELKEDYLIDKQFSNKIIINFINYNLRKFLDNNKSNKRKDKDKEKEKSHKY